MVATAIHVNQDTSLASTIATRRSITVKRIQRLVGVSNVLKDMKHAKKNACQNVYVVPWIKVAVDVLAIAVPTRWIVKDYATMQLITVSNTLVALENVDDVITDIDFVVENVI